MTLRRRTTPRDLFTRRAAHDQGDPVRVGCESVLDAGLGRSRGRVEGTGTLQCSSPITSRAGASGQQLAPSTIMAAPYFPAPFLPAAHAHRPPGNSASHAGMILRMLAWRTGLMTRPGRLFGSRCLRRTRRDGHTAQASPVLSDCTDQPALRVIAAQEGTASGRSERRLSGALPVHAGPDQDVCGVDM